MHIEITTAEVNTRTVRSKKDGKEYTFYTQEAWLHDGTSPYPSRSFVPLLDAASGYRPGRYSLAADALFVDRFGALSLRRNYRLVSDEA